MYVLLATQIPEVALLSVMCANLQAKERLSFHLLGFYIFGKWCMLFNVHMCV